MIDSIIRVLTTGKTSLVLSFNVFDQSAFGSKKNLFIFNIRL